MKIAIIGGTHGNEFVGIEVMKNFKKIHYAHSIHDYECFLGNPRAYEQKKRFVDSDLNRSFGVNGKSQGYETQRSEELTQLISGKFEFLIDLHTTTSNMGLTIILSRNDELSQKAACYLQDIFPEIKLITTSFVNEDCPFTSILAPSGITIEVGPVANNVINAALVMSVHSMVEKLLKWDFKSEINLENREIYKTINNLFYPKEGQWMIHPNLEDAAFKKLKPKDPIFINIKGEEKLYEAKFPVFPFFINEAAYQDDQIAMSLSVKSTLEGKMGKHIINVKKQTT